MTLLEQQALRIVEREEGGWANVAGDAGKRTYRGIASAFWPNWSGWAKIDAWIAQNGEPKWNHIFTEDEIPGLAQDVDDFYDKDFWKEMQGDQFTSPSVAEYLCDWFVNAGGAAIKHIQSLAGVTADGQIGPHSLQAINEAGDALLDKLHDSRDAFYQSVAEHNPTDQKFLKQWLERSDSLYNQLKNAA